MICGQETREWHLVRKLDSANTLSVLSLSAFNISECHIDYTAL